MSTLDEILKWVGFSVQLLPLILQGIMMAEGAIGAGNGDAKKALVMSIFPPANPQNQVIQDTRTVASSLIDGTVATLNKTRKLPLGRHSASPQV
jgi:hypothetical protein